MEAICTLLEIFVTERSSIQKMHRLISALKSINTTTVKALSPGGLLIFYGLVGGPISSAR